MKFYENNIVQSNYPPRNYDSPGEEITPTPEMESLIKLGWVKSPNPTIDRHWASEGRNCKKVYDGNGFIFWIN